MNLRPEFLPGTLRERRVLFTALVVDLFSWARAEHPEWDLAFDEGTVASQRLVWIDGKKVTARDARHVLGSKHYDGEALDYLLYIGGQYISDGEHSAHREIAQKWEDLYKYATSGRRWEDTNHLSLNEGQRQGPLP